MTNRRNKSLPLIIHFEKDIKIGSFSQFLGDLMEAIKRDFGSFDQMKEKLSASSVGVQGSGWGWLVSG